MEQPKNNKTMPGLYIAICFTVIAIGAAGYFTHQAKPKKTDNSALTAFDAESGISASDLAIGHFGNTANDEADQNEDAFVPPVVSEPLPTPQTQETYVEQYAIDNPDIQAASITVNAEDGGLMLDPVPPAAILLGFSESTLIYNELYHDWRTHNGTDIAADVGCSVSSSAEGTVIETGEGSYGGYVVIEHKNGITAVYAQLGSINVKEGDTVGAGEVIGTIGESVGENTKESHLHYEILKDGKYVDPEEY